MRLTKPGVTEKFVGGQVDGVANSYGAMVSFPTISLNTAKLCMEILP